MLALLNKGDLKNVLYVLFILEKGMVTTFCEKAKRERNPEYHELSITGTVLQIPINEQYLPCHYSD